MTSTVTGSSGGFPSDNLNKKTEPTDKQEKDVKLAQLSDKQQVKIGTDPHAQIQRQAISAASDAPFEKSAEILKKQLLEPKCEFSAILDTLLDPKCFESADDEVFNKLRIKFDNEKNFIKNPKQIFEKIYKSKLNADQIFNLLDRVLDKNFYVFSEHKTLFAEKLVEFFFQNPKAANEFVDKHEIGNYEIHHGICANYFLNKNELINKFPKDDEFFQCLKIFDKKSLCLKFLKSDQPIEKVFSLIQKFLGSDQELINKLFISTLSDKEISLDRCFLLVEKGLIPNFEKLVAEQSEAISKKLLYAIFENPSSALKAIQKHKILETLNFSDKTVKEIFREYNSRKFTGVNDKDLAQCLEILFRNKSIATIHYEWLPTALSISNLPISYNLLKTIIPHLGTSVEASLKIEESALQASPHSLTELEKLFFDPKFDNRRSDETIPILSSLLKKIKEENPTIDKKFNYYKALLLSNNSPSKIFKLIDLTIGNQFNYIFSILENEFTNKFLELVFENPVIATVLLEKNKDIFGLKFDSKKFANLLIQHSKAPDFKRNTDLLECINILAPTCNLLFSDIANNKDTSLEDNFKVIEFLADAKTLETALNSKNAYGYNEFIEPFFTLIFKHPAYAFSFMNNPKFHDLLLKYNFDDDKITSILSHLGSIGVMQEKDKDLANCINFLAKNPSIKVVHFQRLLETAVQCDNPNTVRAIINCKGPTELDAKLLSSIFAHDSVDCFKALLNRSHLDIYLTWPLEYINFYQSARCLAFLINQNPKEVLSKIDMGKLQEECNIEMLMAVTQNNEQETAKLLLSSIAPLAQFTRNPAPYEKQIEKLQNHLFKLLRLNSIEEVDQMIECYRTLDPDNGDLLKNFYDSIRKEFMSLAPFLSRHTKQEYLTYFKRGYSPKIVDKDFIVEELDHARECRKHVLALSEKLKDPNFKPTTESFLELPKSSTGHQYFAAWVESISEIRAKMQEERSGEHVDRFKSLRPGPGLFTRISEKYEYASVYTKCVAQFSKAPDMRLTKVYAHYRPILEVIDKNAKNMYGAELLQGYELTHKGKTLNQTTVEPFSEIEPEYLRKQYWYHCKQFVKETWKDVEDCFEKIMNFSIKKPTGNTPKEVETFQTELKELYKVAAEMAWLIGNTTPLKRGSGTVAEWTLALTYMMHGLDPIILKKQFPQLDVLDITFPLSDYKELFPIFFEAVSMLLKTDLPRGISSLSAYQQLKIGYDHINKKSRSAEADVKTKHSG